MEAQYTALRSATREMLDLLRDLKLPTGVLNQLRKYTEASPPGQLADLLTNAMDVSLKVRSTREHPPAPRSRAETFPPRLVFSLHCRTSWTCWRRWTSKRAWPR